MRPGYSVASVPNCSAITSGAWFGSMMPPAPTRIVVVAAATCEMTREVAALAMPGMLWCSVAQAAERASPPSTMAQRSSTDSLSMPGT